MVFIALRALSYLRFTVCVAYYIIFRFDCHFAESHLCF